MLKTNLSGFVAHINADTAAAQYKEETRLSTKAFKVLFDSYNRALISAGITEFFDWLEFDKWQEFNRKDFIKQNKKWLKSLAGNTLKEKLSNVYGNVLEVKHENLLMIRNYK